MTNLFCNYQPSYILKKPFQLQIKKVYYASYQIDTLIIWSNRVDWVEEIAAFQWDILWAIFSFSFSNLIYAT